VEQKKTKEQIRVAKLIAKSIEESISEEERLELNKWLDLSKENELFLKQVLNEDKLLEKIDEYQGVDVAAAKRKVWGKSKRNRFVFRLKRQLKYAAVFLGLIGGTYLYQNGSLFDQNLEEVTIPENAITLQLSNGDVKVIAKEGSQKIINAKGQVVGSQEGDKLNYKNDIYLEELVYNELTVPYGETFQLVLSDGTQVHLNAGTFLKYPVKFIKGENRQVYLKGEAYFDVSKDVLHPFIVNVDAINVRVLGTQFNVSFYPEDENVNTVLVEGSVRVYKEGEIYNVANSSLLKPNQKAAWNRVDKEISISSVDTSIYTAWTEGKLKFIEASFNGILKKLERRYNVTFQNNYKKLEEIQYTATFDIEGIEQVLKVFSEYASFSYTIDKNRRIIINQPK